MTAGAGPLASITVVVDDLDAAVATYRDGVGLLPSPAGRLPRERARVWGRPELAGRRTGRLRAPGDDRPGAVHLVELPGAVAYPPLTSLGWAAAELVVADADAAAGRARAAGWEVLAEPAPVGAGGGLRAVQVGGPGGEALYLTEIRRPPPGFALPRATAPVGRVFIAVLASHDLPGSRALLERELGARRVTDHSLAVRALNHAFGLPPENRHRVSSVQLCGRSAVEIDEYPARAVSRRPGTAGIAAVSVYGVGAARVLELPGAPGAVVELLDT